MPFVGLVIPVPVQVPPVSRDVNCTGAMSAQ